MTLDSRWLFKYNEVLDFICTNHRNPSKHRLEEHNMLNWIKANRKLLNVGSLRADRVELFRGLLSRMEEYRRVNQYQ